jgi:hypothetical protein
VIRVAAREPLLDPTGESEIIMRTRLAARPRSLGGLRLGLLDNTKPNAGAVLSEIATELRRTHAIDESTIYTKSYFGTPVEESQIQRILKNCDFVVAGIGD